MHALWRCDQTEKALSNVYPLVEGWARNLFWGFVIWLMETLKQEEMERGVVIRNAESKMMASMAKRFNQASFIISIRDLWFT